MYLLVVCKDLSSEKLDIVFLFNLDYPDVDRVKNILMFLQSGWAVHKDS